MTDKFIGYFRLVVACEQSGCPVCACIEDDSRRALDTLLYEHITDPEARRELRAARGFCNWHAWSLLEAETAATGAAILYEDLVRECRHRVERLADSAPRRSLRSWLARLYPLVGRSPLSTAGRMVEEFLERPRCPVCIRLDTAEQAYADAIVDFADDPQFSLAYQRSTGLCVQHLLFTFGRSEAPAAIATVVRMTIARWDEVRGNLTRFVAKHEYRNTEPITEEEAASYRLATEIVSGRRDVFTNDMRRRGSRTRSDGDEDRHALELNLAGDCGTNALSERALADLRAENERLRNELAAARRESRRVDDIPR